MVKVNMNEEFKFEGNLPVNEINYEENHTKVVKSTFICLGAWQNFTPCRMQQSAAAFFDLIEDTEILEEEEDLTWQIILSLLASSTLDHQQENILLIFFLAIMWIQHMLCEQIQ